MTFPLSNQWTDLEALNAAKMYARVDQQLNALYNLLSPLLSDTGWLNITVNTGYAALSGNPPQARMLGNIIMFHGGFSNTGLAASGTYTNIGQLPAQVPGVPGTAAEFYPLASSSGEATADLIVNTNGSLDIRIGATLGAYYELNAVSYFSN